MIEYTVYPYAHLAGLLARGDSRGISFDAAEKWLLQGSSEKGRDRFFLLPVLLHEIGHCLGLGHSSIASEVMAPYYVASRVSLTDGDRLRARTMYGVGAASVDVPMTVTEADAYLEAHKVSEHMSAAINDAIEGRASRPLAHISAYLADVQRNVDRTA